MSASDDDDEDIGDNEGNEEQLSSTWFTDDGTEDIDASFKDYDVTASPRQSWIF